MPSFFLASYILLWVAVLLLAVLVLDMARRSRPREKNALAEQERGIPAGGEFPRIRLTNIEGEENPLGAPGQPTVVLFTAIGCHACADLYPDIKPFVIKNPGVRVVVLTVGMEAAVKDLAAKHELAVPVFPVPRDMLREFRVDIFPFGYLLSPDGRVLVKGVVNNIGHLDQLWAIGRRVIGQRAS